jgi:hypothetical protein
MKRKLLLILSVLLMLGAGVVAFAYNTGLVSKSTAMSCCCCSGDSCPMKNKDKASTTDAKSCCDDCDCCKGDSCPMKTKGEQAVQTTAGGDPKSCDCSCCHGKESKTAA